MCIWYNITFALGRLYIQSFIHQWAYFLLWIHTLSSFKIQGVSKTSGPLASSLIAAFILEKKTNSLLGTHTLSFPVFVAISFSSHAACFIRCSCRVVRYSVPHLPKVSYHCLTQMPSLKKREFLVRRKDRGLLQADVLLGSSQEWEHHALSHIISTRQGAQRSTI